MSWHPQGSTSEGFQSRGNTFSVNQSNGGGHGNKQADYFPLYVMNIPTDLTEDQLRDMFSQAGDVARVKCLPPKEGKNSCVGFVDFNSEEDAEKAISMFNNIQMNRSVLRVQFTKAFMEKRGQSPGKQQSSTSVHQNNNNIHKLSNGYAQNAPADQPSQFESHNLHSMGRGIHNYNYESVQPQMGSIGRGIHPQQQTNNQPGMSPYGMNGGPGTAIQPNAMHQGHNHTDTPSNQFQNATGPSPLAYGDDNSHVNTPPQAPPSSTFSTQSSVGPSGNTGKNGMVSEFGNMQLTNQSEPATNHSSGFDQSSATTQYQVSSRIPRMQNGVGSNDKTCHNCGEPGHFSRECPNRSAGSGAGGGCHRCGEQGHFARECPSSSSAGGGNQGGGCHRCGEDGHFARECPKSDQEGSCPRPAQKVDYVPPDIPDDVDLLFKAAVHKGINFDRFDNIPVEVTGSNPPAAITNFGELLLPETLKANLGKADFTKPTPVQKYGIPIILNGRDIMACAQTGSGKTVAFLLPVMAGMVNSRLPATSYLSGDAPSPAALCIAPTRELALQIYTEALKFSSGTYLRPVVCYGGVSVQHQLHQLERGCQILIGTPGRLIDFVGRGKVSLTNVRYLILDEADRMLDMGFENDIRKIVGQFGMPEKTQRQTLMFSATFPDQIQTLAREFLNDYLFLAVGSVGGTNLDIKQEVMDVDGDKKRSTLMDILGQSGTDKTLVFVERKRNADFLASWLSQNNYPATSISGDRTQKEREDALRDFRNGRAPILIATSVAARGLDIPDVKHVVNYDLPQQIEEYVHRIGRTGRIGNQGKATAFFDRRSDDKLARSLVKVLSDALQEVPNWLEEVAERALGTSYGPEGGRFASRDTRQLGGRGNSPGNRNSRPPVSTNVSFANTSWQQGQEHPAGQRSTTNVHNDADEEEWD